MKNVTCKKCRTKHLDVKRVESNRNGILCCCYKHGRDYKPSECSKKDLTNVIFDKVIAQNMVKLPVKVLVLMAALGLLGANIYGFTQLEQKFDPIWFVPESSLARQFSNAADEQFPSGGQVGSVYFTSLNYFQDIPKIERIQRNLLDSKNARIGSIDSWATDFFLFINTTAEEYDKNPMSKEKFSETMWSFLCDSPYGFAVRNSFLFNNSLDCLNTANPVIEDIQASVLNYQYDSMSGSAIQIEAMRTTKEIIANEQLVSVEPEAEVGAFAFSPAFGNWITDEVIGDELLRNMLLALLCVLIMTLILIASIPTCLMVLLCH
ncbi:unnamed protein product [Notodromas monacha]|uniref:Uncharacterized protein n=1 Tax=Notodromas monacha TaxID=399045 RepID=A0A7R9GFQ3_9CRUS|nr:unnamed protein product [Notodromas monacha]CAG0919583.1 unnamed protein product [Notodromas monacha]